MGRPREPRAPRRAAEGRWRGRVVGASAGHYPGGCDRLRAVSVVIDRRFNGPPASGQGGYSAGLLAERIPSDCAAVSLRLPPPLDTPLEIEERDDGTVA